MCNWLLVVLVIIGVCDGGASVDFSSEVSYIELSEDVTGYEVCINTSTEMAPTITLVYIEYKNMSALGEKAKVWSFFPGWE
jgi:hypothetical protein